MRARCLQGRCTVAVVVAAAALVVAWTGRDVTSWPLPGVEAVPPAGAPKKAKVATTDEELQGLTIYNMAVNMERAGDMDAAVRLYREALELMPHLADAHLNLGNLFSLTDRLDLALEHLHEAHRYAASAGDMDVVAGSLNNMGLVLQRQAGRDMNLLEDAAAVYTRCLDADPAHTEAMYNLGRVRETQGDLDEAERWYKRILSVHPQHTGAMTNMGNLRLLQHRLQEAADYYMMVGQVAASGGDDNQEAAKLNQVAGLHNLAQTLQQAREMEAAMAVLEELVTLRPDDVLALASLQAARRGACVWDHTADADRLVAGTRLTVERAIGSAASQATVPAPEAVQWKDAIAADRAGVLHEGMSVFDALMVPVSRAWIRDLAVSVSKLHSLQELPQLSPHVFTALAPSPASGQLTRLRIAYASYDFREHPMGHLTLGPLLRHNRDRVQVLCYHYGPGTAARPAPGTNAEESMTAVIASACDSFVHAANMTASDIADHISQAGAHVLVDLMAHTTHGRAGIVAAKPAPIVVNYLGCPCTSGSPMTDYVLVDAVVAPMEEGDAFTEARVYLPHTYQSNYYKLSHPLCRDEDGSCLLARRLEFGLPTDPRIVVLANFNNVDKIRVRVFDTWMRILSARPETLLWLIAPHDPAVSTRLKQHAQSRGIHASRIIFAPRMERSKHLERYQAVDLYLDTHVYTAHTTAADALWGAAPILVTPAPTFQGRVSASLLRSLHAPWLVASSFKAFEDTGVRMVRKRQQFAWRLRRHISHKLLATPTFDSTLQAALLERSYRAMWDFRRAAGLSHTRVAPRQSLWHIVVDPQDRHTPVPTADLVREIAAQREVADGGVPSQPVWSQLAVRCGGGRALQAVLRLESRIDTAIQTGLREQRADRRAAAAAVYERVLAVDPDHPDALHYTGLLASQRGDHELAMTLVDRSIRNAQTFPLFSEAAYTRNAHAVLQAAADHFRGRVQSDPGDVNAYWNWGKAADELGDWPARQQAFWAAVWLQHQRDFAQSAPDRRRLSARVVPRPPHKRTVAIYCDEYGQSWWRQWGPRALLPGGSGAGGSEEAAILLARAMVALGTMHVEVYTDLAEEDIGVAADGVVWYPYQWYDVDNPPDAFVTWRYGISASVGRTSPRVHVWLQDLINMHAQFPAAAVAHIDTIILLCQFHASKLPAHAAHKAVLSTNAMDPAGFVDGVNNPLTFIYASSPTRGLEQVLTVWPSVYTRLGGARTQPRLLVYYGFTAGFERHARKVHPNYDEWRAHMDALLQADGVEYIGLVPPAELARGYAEAGFALYPTSYPETSCVAMMKAMAMGAIPISSRHPSSALPELTRLFDLGPPVPSRYTATAAEASIADDPEWLQQWADNVVAAARGKAESLHGLNIVGADDTGSWLSVHRATMKAWARKHLTWHAVASHWQEFLFEPPQGSGDDGVGGIVRHGSPAFFAGA